MMSDPIVANPATPVGTLADTVPARTRADVEQAIARVVQEHLTSTGRPAFHLGRCARGDLHDQLAGLYAQARDLQGRVRL